MCVIVCVCVCVCEYIPGEVPDEEATEFALNAGAFQLRVHRSGVPQVPLSRLPSPALSPTDPVPRGILTLCPGASSGSKASCSCGNINLLTHTHTHTHVGATTAGQHTRRHAQPLMHHTPRSNCAGPHILKSPCRRIFTISRHYTQTIEKTALRH